MNLDDLKNLQNLDPSNPGSWPIFVKAGACAALFIALLIANYVFITEGQRVKLDQEKKQEEELRHVYATKQHKAVNLDAYRQQMQEMQQSFGAMLRQLPGETEVAELLVDISQTGLASGLEFEMFKPAQEVKQEFYAELPIDIRVTGIFHEFGNFVSGVAALPRIATLHDFTISEADDETLTMEIMAKTYRYSEEESE